MVMGLPLEKIRTLVANESVALVGNAASLSERSNPINQQVVVRINGGPFAEGAAKRADQRRMLLVSGFQDKFPEEQCFEWTSNIVWMTPKHRDSLAPETSKRLYFYPQEWWDALFSRIGARPSTGCMGIDMLSRLIGDGELHLYGFDFWKSPTSYTNEIRPGPHAPSAEEEYARSLIPPERIH